MMLMINILTFWNLIKKVYPSLTEEKETLIWNHSESGKNQSPEPENSSLMDIFDDEHVKSSLLDIFDD